MSNQFRRFKRKLLWIRLIKSILAGLSCGAATGGVLHFLSKFGFVAMELGSILLIATSACVGVGALLFLLLHRTDKGFARRLDREFALEERVQTAVAYRNEQSTMHQLQREDAEQAMQAVARKRLKFGNLWIYILAVVLSLAVLWVSLILYPYVEEPPAAGEEEEEVIPYSLSEVEEQALLVLIDDVRASAMESPYRENVVAALEDLLASLRKATIMDERDAALTLCVETIHEETDRSSQAIEVIEALWYSGDDRVRKLADAINYYDWSEGDTLDERMEVFALLLQPLSATEEGVKDSVKMADAEELINAVIDSITFSLTGSGVASTDPLVTAIYNMANNAINPNNPRDTANLGLKGCLQKGIGFTVGSSTSAGVGYERMQIEWIGPKLKMHKGVIGGVLTVHETNTTTGEQTMLRLQEVFGCELPEFDRPSLVDDGDQEQDDDTPSGGGQGVGGGIGGGTVYGSDDLVLDPKTDTYVEYGTILNDYYALMFGKGESGVYTEEEKALLEKYFQILYGTDYEQ